jgi:hypothetical protein
MLNQQQHTDFGGNAAQASVSFPHASGANPCHQQPPLPQSGCPHGSSGRTASLLTASRTALARYFEARRDPVDCPLLLRQTPVFAQHGPYSAGQGSVLLCVKAKTDFPGAHVGMAG